MCLDTLKLDNELDGLGAQIWVAYPKCGLTRARYSVRLTSVLTCAPEFIIILKVNYNDMS